MRWWLTCRTSAVTRRGDADMNSGIVSGIVTAVLLVVFLGVVAWAWSHRRKPDFDAAARLPLHDNDGDRP